MSQQHAAGPFDVTLTPQGQPTVLNGATTGRMAIDKLYHGDLNGRGSGEMLSAMTVTEGSAGYVNRGMSSGSAPAAIRLASQAGSIRPMAVNQG